MGQFILRTGKLSLLASTLNPFWSLFLREVVSGVLL